MSADAQTAAPAETDELAMHADAVKEVDGELVVKNSTGLWVPLETIKPQHIDEDRVVRGILGHADELNARITRFKGHTMDDVVKLLDRVAEVYGGSKGGPKGNVTLTTFDGCMKVIVQTQDMITFGPELQVAKGLVDEFIDKWSEGVDPKILALLTHAFQVDREGRINRAALLQLRRLDIDDDTWRAAMAVLADAQKPLGSKEYVRFYRRPNFKARWEPVTINLAAA